MRSSCTPAASSDASQTIGGPITAGISSAGPPDGTSSGITKTHLAGFQVTFFNATSIARLFADGWRLLQCARREEIDILDPSSAFASWLVVAEKI